MAMKKKHKGKGNSHRKIFEQKNTYNSNRYIERQDNITQDLNYRYQNGGMQLVYDASFLACREMFGMGKGRATRFALCLNKWINYIAELRTEDKRSNEKHNTQYSRQKIDDMLRAVIGEESFQPWEVRYADSQYAVFDDEED